MVDGGGVDARPLGDPARRPMVSVAFGLTCAAYLAATTAEALLAPVFPEVAGDLDLGVADAGRFFAALAASIAGGTVLGGLATQRFAPSTVAAAGLVGAAGGCGLAALADEPSAFLVAQILIGAGSGFLWPAAVLLVGRLAGPEGRGLAMGIFGTAFSGGLVLAALLAAAGGRFHWRAAFVSAAVLALAAALALRAVRSPVPTDPPGPIRAALAGVLGLPSLVGVVAGISQYATVSFLPVFAVEVWALSGATAALVLAAGRILSIPLKVVVGVLADRVGPERAVGALGLALTTSGLLWALVPGRWLAGIGAVAFAALVSGLFPLANVLALARSGRRGSALGVFRALQIGAGALVGLLLGLTAERYGLRPTIAVASAGPVVLVALVRRPGPGSGSTISGG